MNKKYEEPRKSIPESVKQQIRIEARHCCAICKIPSPLEFHHIDENRTNNMPENIILLCRNHHGEYHKGNIQRKELIQYKKKLQEDFLTAENHELNFYLEKIQSVTEGLCLEQWGDINYLIGQEHTLPLELKDKFEKVADEINRTSFPNGIYQDINSIFRNLAENISNLINSFISHPHVEVNCNQYFLSRSWKGICQYSSEQYEALNQMDIDFEVLLCRNYLNLCLVILEMQEYIWEKLDYGYLDRLGIQITFHSYFAPNKDLVPVIENFYAQREGKLARKAQYS